MDINKEQLSAKLNLLEKTRFTSEAIDNTLSEMAIQNWCGEGCRGDCKGGGFFD